MHDAIVAFDNYVTVSAHCQWPITFVVLEECIVSRVGLKRLRGKGREEMTALPGGGKAVAGLA